MGIKQKAISLAAQMLSLPAMSQRLEKRYGGRGVILMFHDISETANVVNKAGNISADFFETILKRIKSSGLEPVRLIDLPEKLESQPDKRFVVLTFDDGYKSTLDLAVPFLEKYQLPATVFVTSGALTGRLNYYWGALEQYLHSHDSIAIGGMKFQTLRLNQKQKAYRDIMHGAIEEPEFWEVQLRDFFNHHGIDFRASAAEDFLDHDGIKALHYSDLIDVGGHTVSHPVLSNLQEREAFQEIIQNKKDLENLLEHEVPCFAYPFGGPRACGDREFELAKKAGYKLAVTARCGTISTHDLHALPRIGVSGRYESKAVLDLYLNGAWVALRSLAISKK